VYFTEIYKRRAFKPVYSSLILVRISVKFEDKFCEIQLDFEKKTTIDGLITLVREVFKIQNVKIYLKI
jgi:hypothetical protein